MKILRPQTFDDARHAKLHLGAAGMYVAGGTIAQFAQPAAAGAALVLIDVSHAVSAEPPELVELRAGTALRIGCRSTLETLRRSTLARDHAPLLAAACNEIAALGVRHLATLGGNIGWRFGDCIAPLLVMNALAELEEGELVPLEQVLGEGEVPLIGAVHVGVAPEASDEPVIEFYEKVGHRQAFTPSRIAMACRVRLDGSRKVVSADVAATGAGIEGRRMRSVQQLLVGKDIARLDARDVGRAAAQDLGSDHLFLARVVGRIVAGRLQAAMAPVAEALAT